MTISHTTTDRSDGICRFRYHLGNVCSLDSEHPAPFSGLHSRDTFYLPQFYSTTHIGVSLQIFPTSCWAVVDCFSIWTNAPYRLETERALVVLRTAQLRHLRPDALSNTRTSAV